jgi:hypothetical protein
LNWVALELIVMLQGIGMTLRRKLYLIVFAEQGLQPTGRA